MNLNEDTEARLWCSRSSVCDTDDDYSSSQSPMSVSSLESEPQSPSPSSSSTSSRSSSSSSSWWCEYKPYSQFAQVRWYRDDRGLYQARGASQQPLRAGVSRGDNLTEKSLEMVRRGKASDLELYLKNYSCNVNAIGYAGDSPLHAACRTGNLDIVKTLLRYGADPELTNREGWSPVHLAVYSGNQDVAGYLLSLTECRRHPPGL